VGTCDQVVNGDLKSKRTKKAKKAKTTSQRVSKSSIKNPDCSFAVSAENGDDDNDNNADNEGTNTNFDEIGLTEVNQDHSFIAASSVNAVSATCVSSAPPVSENVLMQNVKTCFNDLVGPLSDNVEVLKSQVKELMILTQRLSAQITFLVSQSQQPTSLPHSSQPSQQAINQTMPSTQSTSSYSAAAASTQHTQGRVRQSQEAQRDAVTAMYVDLDKKQRRSSNIVISGLASGSQPEDDAKVVIKLLCGEYEWDVSEWPGVNVIKCRRLGKKHENKPQPLLVTLESPLQAQYYISNAKWLRTSSIEEVRNNVYINGDLTPSEAKAAYELRLQRKQRAQRDATSQSDTQPVSRPGRTIYRSHGASTAAATAVTSVGGDCVTQPNNEVNSNLAAERPISLQWRQPATSVLKPAAVSITGAYGPGTTTSPVTPGRNAQAPSFLPSSTKQPSGGSSQQPTRVPAAGRPSIASQ